MSVPAAVRTDRLTRFSQAIGRHIPDAMSTAVGMLLLLAVGALAIGNSGMAVMDAFYRGLWMLLPFTIISASNTSGLISIPSTPSSLAWRWSPTGMSPTSTGRFRQRSCPAGRSS
jgi:hypothetical protein